MFDTTFTVIGFSWMIFEIAVGQLMYANEDKNELHDANTLNWVNIIIYSSIIAGFYCEYAIEEIGVFAQSNTDITWFGLIVMGLGFVLRVTSIITLRKYFTVNLAINNEHKLINQGLYKYVRHPSYSGSIMSFIGMGIAFGNALSLILLVIPVTALFMWRIAIEEEMLVGAFKDKYLEYKENSWRLLPWVY